MKRWIIVLLIIVGLLIVVGYLYDQGYLQNMRWQGATMVAAILAGPYVAIKNWLTANKEDVNEILQNNQQTVEQEKKHRKEMDAVIEEREKRIKNLDKEIDLLDKKMQLLEKKKELIDKEVENMSLDETQNELNRLLK